MLAITEDTEDTLEQAPEPLEPETLDEQWWASFQASIRRQFQWYSVRQTARYLQLKEVRIRQMLASGQLKGQKIGRAWYVKGHEISRYHRVRKPAGRPRGSKFKLDVLGRRRLRKLSKKEAAEA